MRISQYSNILFWIDRVEAVEYFKAMADETRLRMINLLLEREMNVGEISTVLEMRQSRVSRHLKILAEKGLLIHRRDGLWIFYRTPQSGDGRAFIDSISYLFDRIPLLSSDLKRVEEVRRERKKATTRLFDSLAGDWEVIKRELLGSFDLNDEILKRTPQCRVAVDLGCGTGDLLVSLTQRAERVIGVDNSPSMLERAAQSFSNNREGIDLRLGDLDHLPLKDREVDFALVNMVLHHLLSPARGLAEAARVLKTGGRLILIDLDQHSNEVMRNLYGDRWLGFRPEEIESWLKATGFKVEEKAFFPIRRGMSLFIYGSIKQEEKNDES